MDHIIQFQKMFSRGVMGCLLSIFSNPWDNLCMTKQRLTYYPTHINDAWGRAFLLRCEDEDSVLAYISSKVQLLYLDFRKKIHHDGIKKICPSTIWWISFSWWQKIQSQGRVLWKSIGDKLQISNSATFPIIWNYYRKNGALYLEK